MHSEIVYKGRHYIACAMRDGSLIVTSCRIQKGKRLLAPAAEMWVQAIRTAVDAAEAHALCASIMRG